MEQSRSRWFATFMGGFIGVFLGLSASRQFHWPWQICLLIGVCTGAPLAYLAYDLNEVRRGTVRAWKKTTTWQPDRESWKDVCLLVFLFLTWMEIWWIIVVHVNAITHPTDADQLCVGACTLYVMIGPTVAFALATSDDFRKGKLASRVAKLILLNPVGLLMVMMHYIGIGVIWSARRAPAAASVALSLSLRMIDAVRTFVCEFLRYIHSDERRVCLTGTAFGIAFGFLIGLHFNLPTLTASLVGGLISTALAELEYRIAGRFNLLPAH